MSPSYLQNSTHREGPRLPQWKLPTAGRRHGGLVGDRQVGVLGIKQRRHPGPHSKAPQTDSPGRPWAEGTVRCGPGQASARKGNTHGLLVSFANGSLRREEEREEVRGHRNTVEAFRTLRLPSTARSLPGPSWLAPSHYWLFSCPPAPSGQAGHQDSHPPLSSVL